MPNQGHSSFYDLLGVAPDATAEELRAGYFRAAQEWHPDLNRDDLGAEQRFKQIRRVYEILVDPIQRAAYDEDPSRFRLSETGVVSVDAEVVIRRARHPDNARTEPPWTPERDAQGRQDAGEFRPQPTTTRSRTENLWVFVGGISAMLALTIAAVAALRTHRETFQRHSQSSETLDATSTSPLEDAQPEPIETVIASIDALRPSPSERSVARDPVAQSPESHEPSAPNPPKFDFVDELNLPLPGFPVLPLPSTSSPSATVTPAPLPSRPLPTPVNDNQSRWDLPGQADFSAAEPLSAYTSAPPYTQSNSMLSSRIPPRNSLAPPDTTRELAQAISERARQFLGHSGRPFTPSTMPSGILNDQFITTGVTTTNQLSFDLDPWQAGDRELGPSMNGGSLGHSGFEHFRTGVDRLGAGTESRHVTRPGMFGMRSSSITPNMLRHRPTTLGSAFPRTSLPGSMTLPPQSPTGPRLGLPIGRGWSSVSARSP